jgi:hypothetical protein
VRAVVFSTNSRQGVHSTCILALGRD